MTVIENCLAIGDGTSADRYIDLRGTKNSRSGTMNYRVANCSAFDSNTFIRLGNGGGLRQSAQRRAAQQLLRQLH